MSIDISKLFNSSEATDGKSFTFLLKALKSNSSDGFDYLKFRKSIQTLKDMDMDEATAIKSAFATASTMGLSKDKLSKSIGYYKKVLEKEKKAFDQATSRQINDKVSGKKKEKDALNSKNLELEKKILDMQTQMQIVNQKLSTIDEELDKAKQKITETTERYEGAFNELYTQIEEDESLITKHL